MGLSEVRVIDAARFHLSLPDVHFGDTIFICKAQNDTNF